MRTPGSKRFVSTGPMDSLHVIMDLAPYTFRGCSKMPSSPESVEGKAESREEGDAYREVR
jgi:hypothetical protein